jgi:hypothetical protein
MPERFTLSELQAVHETILGEPLDKRNFRKRVLALDCIEATERDGAMHGGRSSSPLVPGQASLAKSSFIK